MDLLLDIILVIASILMLWKGADWLVESAAEIAHSLKISDLVIGLTVVAFGTSAPEFAVTIRAAITGQTDISIGNVVGSNIFNLGFILGGTAMIRAINITPKSILLEPIGRNTAPAITIAALRAIKDGEDPILLILASDHEIKNKEKLQNRHLSSAWALR